MVINKFLTLILLLFFACFLFAEEEINIPQDEDLEEEELEEEVILLLRENLQQEIANIHYLTDYYDLPFFVFAQNFHLSSLFSTPFWIEKNGFLLTSTKAEAALQLYAPFYELTNSDYFFHLQTSDYHEQVALAKSYLGMGANDMNHAFVSFRKGNLLQRFTGEFAFLTYDGIWHSNNELAKMYHGNLFFPSKIGTWLVSSTVIEKFHQQETEKLKGHDFDIVWENPYFRFGFRCELLEESKEYKENQYFVEKKGEFKNHSYQLKLSYLREKNFYYQIGTKSDFSTFSMNNRAIWKDKHSFSWQSSLALKSVHEFQLHVSQNSFPDDDEAYFYPAFSGGISWNYRTLFTQKISYENYSFDEEMYHGAALENSIEMKINTLKFRYENKAQIIQNQPLQLPNWLFKQKISLAKYLQHDNRIKLGLSHYYSGDFYSEFGEKYHIHVLNAFVQFQISKLFEIQFSGINLLLHSFRPYIPYEEAYLSVGLKWIFVN